MPYGTPSLDVSARSQEKKEKSTSRNGSEVSTSGANNRIQLTPDAVSQTSFIPLGVFSNQELFEVDAVRLRNRTIKRKKHLIDQSDWRAPSDNEVPWLIKNNGQQYKSVTQRLHYEIEELVAYFCPTDIECLWRVFAIKRIEQCIKSCYPNAEIMVFGSFNTGLYLPTSDLDIVCFIKENSPNNNILRKIAQLLDYYHISAERATTLTRAVVPIIKFRERYTMFNVDISFNQSSGYISARAMKSYLDLWPSLGKMVVLVKWFLKHHELDDPSIGGMGGFTVFCMMLSFFQTHPLIRNGTLIPDDDNLGVLLIEFFELYGLNFNFFKVAIRVNNDGEYVLKDKESWTTKRDANICIQDPSDSDNDIARSTSNTEVIFSHFEKAFLRLVVRVGSLERKYRGKDNEIMAGLNEESILSSILFIPRKVIEFRRELHHLYANNQRLIDDHGAAHINPPSFSHILHNFQYEIECADRIKREKSKKLSNKYGTYNKVRSIRTKNEYLDMAYRCRNEVDTYREFPCERSTFLLATYGETYKKVFAYSDVELESKTKNKNKYRDEISESVAGSSKGGSSRGYKRNTYNFEKSSSSSSRGYERHREIFYTEHDSDEYEDYNQPAPKRRRKGEDLESSIYIE